MTTTEDRRAWEFVATYTRTGEKILLGRTHRYHPLTEGVAEARRARFAGDYADTHTVAKREVEG